jgi:hypothetical protein
MRRLSPIGSGIVIPLTLVQSGGNFANAWQHQPVDRCAALSVH